MFRGLAPYPQPANLGQGSADGAAGFLNTSLGRGKVLLSGHFTVGPTPGDLGGSRGFRADRSDYGVPVGFLMTHKGRLKWAGPVLDYETDELVLAFDAGGADGFAGVGDIFRVSPSSADGTPTGGTTRGPKAIWGAGVGTPKNEPADFNILAGHQFGLHVRPYNLAAGSGGVWIKNYGDTWPAILLDQVNPANRAMRIDFGNGVNHRLMSDVDGANIQTFTLVDIATGHRIFHIIGDAMQIGGAQAATVTPLTIAGNASQSVDVTQWYKGGTLVAKMRGDGLFGAAFLTNALDSGPYLEMKAAGGAIEVNNRGGGSYPMQWNGASGAAWGFNAGADTFQNLLAANESTTASTGASGAPPAQVLGYLRLMKTGGTYIKIPYYAV